MLVNEDVRKIVKAPSDKLRPFNAILNLVGIQCKIRSRAFIWSPFDLIERITIKILCLVHNIFYPNKR